MEAIINRGVSGSGKSTFTAKHPNHKVISKDIYRREFVKSDPNINFWSQYTFDKDVEKAVQQRMEQDIKKYAEEKADVILDNTNLSNKKTAHFERLFAHHGYKVVINNCNYTDNINTYLHNNESRLHTVPSRALNDQYIFACQQDLIPLKSNRILLVDIDGTVALKGDRGIFEYDKADVDLPNQYVIDVINRLYQADYCDYIQFLTGRESFGYDVARTWLSKQGFDMSVHRLLSRKTRDYRKDSIIKSEIYENCLQQNKIVGVFDDRPQVVGMWWDKRLPVFHVGDYRDDF